MVSPRRLLSGAAVGSAVVILSAMLSGSAVAAADPPGCSNENAGAAGLTLPKCGSALLHGAVQVNLPGASVAVPSCPDATAALVQAHIVVGGVNGHGGTSTRLTNARKADDAARAKLQTDLAADKTEDTDYNTSHIDAQDSTLANDIGERDQAVEGLKAAAARPDDGKPITDKTGKAYAVAFQTQRLANANTAIVNAQAADAAEDGIGTDETPQDAQDLAVANDRTAINGPNGTAARLAAAQAAEGTAEQGVVDAEVVIGLACKNKPVPQPPAVVPPAPAPIEQGQQVIIYPAVPGQPPTADSQTVDTHLPVTG